MAANRDLPQPAPLSHSRGRVSRGSNKIIDALYTRELGRAPWAKSSKEGEATRQKDKERKGGLTKQTKWRTRG